MLLFANNADSALKVGALATDTTLFLLDGMGARFPEINTPGDTFFVTLVDGIGNTEIVEVTARDGDVLTVTRARDGTTAKSFPAGAVVDHRLVAEVLRRMSPANLRGAPNGLAPLDADSRLPAENLPASLMTQTAADARYMRLSNANAANGFPQLDAQAKILMANLPAELLTATEGDATYVPLTMRGAANGVAPLDADGKLPATAFNPALVDLSPYAKKAAPEFTGGIKVTGDSTMGGLSVTGGAQFADVEVAALSTTEPVTIAGGAPRGRLTLSTQPPSGTPGEGDEWIQHEA